MDYAPVRYGQLLEYARGTLELRKKRNRKRTITGDYVWTDEADLIFAWGLIIWHSEPSVRSGTKRSFFLESFLNDRGIKKTRKQIASRLQVLKGEWHTSPYEKFLKHPNDALESPPASPTPPHPDERLIASSSTSRTHSQTSITELDDTGSPSQSNMSNKILKIPGISPVMATSNSTLFPLMSYPESQRLDSLVGSSLSPGADHNPIACGSMGTPQQYSDASLQQNTSCSSSHIFLRQPCVDSRREGSVPEQSFTHSYCAPLHCTPYRNQDYHQRGLSPASSGKSGFGTASPSNVNSPPHDLAVNRETGLSLPTPRGLVGIAHDYPTTISQLSRVGLNEQQVAMNRRQVPSHGINGAFMSPIERPAPEGLISNMAVPSLSPIMTPTEGYGQNSFHRPGESNSKPSLDQFYPSTYSHTY